jgi:hypothetical protein
MPKNTPPHSDRSDRKKAHIPPIEAMVHKENKGKELSGCGKHSPEGMKNLHQKRH